jgi:hypothetical protein
LVYLLERDWVNTVEELSLGVTAKRIHSHSTN